MFQCKCIRKSTRPFCWNVKGQLSIIIWINLVDHKSKMLYTKSPASWLWRRRFSKGFYHIWAWQTSWSNSIPSSLPLGSGEESFQRVFTIYGHGRHLGQTLYQVPCLLALEKKVFKGFLPYMGMADILVKLYTKFPASWLWRRRFSKVFYHKWAWQTSWSNSIPSSLPLGSGEEDFQRFFTINGHGRHLGQTTWTIKNNNKKNSFSTTGG